MSSQQIAFGDIPVSTTTIIGIANFYLDMVEAYKITNIANETVTQMQNNVHVSRKKVKIFIELDKFKNGDVLGKSFGLASEGFSKRNKKTFFRNAATIMIKVRDKKVNFKISSSRLINQTKFQITGCKSVDHAIETINLWYNMYIRQHGLVETTSPDECVIIFTTVMVNINLDLGFNINREKLDYFINANTDYMSLLETSFGYTGLNVKAPIQHANLLRTTSHKVTFNRDQSTVWRSTRATFADFLEMLPARDKEKWVTKKRYGSFLIFYSGKVIFSSFNYDLMHRDYDIFMKIIDDCKTTIMETRTFI